MSGQLGEVGRVEQVRVTAGRREQRLEQPLLVRVRVRVRVGVGVGVSVRVRRRARRRVSGAVRRSCGEPLAGAASAVPTYSCGRSFATSGPSQPRACTWRGEGEGGEMVRRW